MEVNGTAGAPCKFTANAAVAQRWGGLLFDHASGMSHLNYLILEKASAGKQRIFFPAAISAFHSDLSIDHLTATEVFDNPVVGRFSNISLRNSTLKITATGDGVNIKYGNGIVENSVFEGSDAVDADGIDFDGVTDGIVRHNVIRHFRGINDDGLDIGEQCKNLLVEENFIYDCFDKGISIGQQSEVIARNNTIAYTTLGMGLKDQSPVSVDHCTIFGTQTGISAYEKHAGDLGGHGTVTNTVVANSAETAFFADTTASLTITNSLSDTGPRRHRQPERRPAFYRSDLV